MKQDEARVLNDQELEKVSGGMFSDNPEGHTAICPYCGRPVFECTCTKSHLGNYSPTDYKQA